MHGPNDSLSKPEVTQLLKAWTNGEQEALEKLTPLVYNELHRLAHKYMARELPGHALQTTALVNEAYLRMVDAQEVTWQNRSHFFAVSAQIMRRILTDIARSQHYLKRGGQAPHVSLDEVPVVSRQQNVDMLALDEALDRLAALDPRKCQVVELRYFSGLSVEETAEALNISVETVMRDWKFAKAWLHRGLSGENHDGP
jgi:RNA polymerase sigma factor (TIGR02999 family)